MLVALSVSGKPSSNCISSVVLASSTVVISVETVPSVLGRLFSTLVEVVASVVIVVVDSAGVSTVTASSLVVVSVVAKTVTELLVSKSRVSSKAEQSDFLKFILFFFLISPYSTNILPWKQSSCQPSNKNLKKL